MYAAVVHRRPDYVDRIATIGCTDAAPPGGRKRGEHRDRCRNHGADEAGQRLGVAEGKTENSAVEARERQRDEPDDVEQDQANDARTRGTEIA